MRLIKHESVANCNTNVDSKHATFTPVKIPDETLADRCRATRIERGFKYQKDLAKEAGVSPSTISNIENGLRLEPRTLPPIAKALRVEYHWLREKEGPKDLQERIDPSQSKANNVNGGPDAIPSTQRNFSDPPVPMQAGHLDADANQGDADRSSSPPEVLGEEEGSMDRLGEFFRLTNVWKTLPEIERAEIIEYATWKAEKAIKRMEQLQRANGSKTVVNFEHPRGPDRRHAQSQGSSGSSGPPAGKVTPPPPPNNSGGIA